MAPAENHFPDLVVEKILGLLPTKLAVGASLVSKQWRHMWSLQVPELDFDDEYDNQTVNPTCRWDHHRRRSQLFTKYMKKCLEHYKQSKRDNVPLDKFRLRAASYGSSESIIRAGLVRKWMNFAAENNVQDLSISLGHRGLEEKKYHCIRPAKTLLNAEFLTSLNLEYVKLGNFKKKESFNRVIETPPLSYLVRKPLFPCLKTMSLNAVVFEDRFSLPSLTLCCPSLHYLSLTSCSVLNCWNFIFVESPSLKSLQILHCKDFTVRVGESENLEGLTLVSEAAGFMGVEVSECSKLKDVSIDAPNLKTFRLKCSLNHPEFHLLRAPNLSEVNLLFTVSPWPFRTLRDLLANFDICGRVYICVPQLQALIFPEDVINTSSPPLPSAKSIVVIGEARDGIVSDVKRSLRWMAPSANIHFQ